MTSLTATPPQNPVPNVALEKNRSAETLWDNMMSEIAQRADSDPDAYIRSVSMLALNGF